MSLVDRSRLTVLVVGALLGALASERADACGPDFPNQVLRDRRATMLQLVDGSFDWDMAHLVPGPDAGSQFLVREGDGWRFGDTHADPARNDGGSVERALYDEAAQHFHAGDPLRARALWQRLLKLPRDERIHRSTWAAFMLGRVTQDPKWFRTTRALATDGFHDALGLAVASFGEEARIELHEGRVAAAVKLYAEQAAHGSEIGRTSLLFVARDLVNDEDALARAARDPLVRKLVSSYLYARSNELEGAWDNTHVAKVTRLVTLLERHGRTHDDDGADRLAAAAYRAGQWQLAALLALLNPDAPLSTWVRAKLALRDGRLDEARLLLARASSAFPADADWGVHWMAEGGDSEIIGPRARVDAERAVLALEAREYTTALTQLLAPDDRYWADAAYIAERVLSVDELLAYVNANVPYVKPVESCWGGEVTTARNRLRTLLARRLMRADRVDEALAFFDVAERREQARAYGALVATGRDLGRDRYARSRALWEASAIARTSGLEILGFELDPDWALYDGGYDLGDDGGWAMYDESVDVSRERPRGDVMVPGTAFSSFDEQMRVAATVARPLARFHYRIVAAELAADAASLLPPRSQAYAASLCTAASYVINQHPERASAYWQRYVDNGAAVDFRGVFGRTCPNPDFESAARRYDDKDQLRPLARMNARDLARDVALLCGIALATHVLARALTRRGRRGAGLP